MKHLKLFFALFAMLALGVGNTWGAEIVFETNASDASSALTTSTLENQVSSGADYIASVGFDIARVYQGKSGLKFGNSSTGGVLTLNLATEAQIANPTITIKSAKYNSKNSLFDIFVNGSSTANATATVGTDLTFTYTGTITTIQIKGKKPSNGDTRAYLSSINIEGNGGDEPVASLTATPTAVEFGTIEQGSIVADQTISVNFANLTDDVTYSALSNPFTATGTVRNSGDNITIAANTATIGEYSQTLTIASVADDKSVEVVVTMNVVAPFEGKKLVFDFVTHPSGWPAAKANATAGSYVYTLDEVDYTFSHTKSGDGIYLGGTSKTSGYLMLASGNKLGLPAIKGYKLVKVDGTLNGSGTPSTASQVSITNAGGTVISGGTAQTWDTKGGTKTYNLTDTEANTVYYLTVANKNLQMITLALYYEEVAGAVDIPDAPTLTASQEFETETFTVEISAVDGATIHYTLDGSDPTEASTTYSAPFTVNATTTVKAIAVKDGVASNVATATYTKVSVIEKTCAEAAALCTSDESTDKYRVEGYVTAIETAYSAQYNNITVWMADTRNGGNVLQAFRATPTVDADKAVKVGDKIEVVGKLKLYNSVPEIVSGTYTITQPDPVYAVNITSEHGTATATPASAVEGTEITLSVEVESGWVFQSWTVTDASSNTIEVTDNKFTMPASDVTVVANYTESVAADAVLKLSANGVVTSNTYKVGETVKLPETIVNDCVKKFVGWSAGADCTTTPEYAPGADFTLTAEEHTLYAVYGTQTGGGEGVLTKMTSTDAFANGDKVVIVAYGTQLGMYQETSGTTYVKYWELVDNEPTVAELDDKTIWDVEADGENWKIGDATTGYLYNASSNNLAVSTTNASIWTITWKENGFVFKSDLGRYMACRTDLTTSNKNLYRMNGTTIGNNGVYEMDVYKYTSSAPIYSEFSTTCSAAPDAPVFSVGTGTYNAAQTVSITAEEGATIHYTLNGNDPTDKSDVYSSALTISETTTLKAIAVKDGIASTVTTATYTINLPLTTIDQIFAKATAVGSTATTVEIIMGGWTVSGANDKNVFVTDGTKGFIIYKSDEGHGFVAGDVLSGTVACKVQLFKGSAELTELTSTTSGLTVTPGGTVTPVTLDAAGITALTGVNTGSVIKINGTCTLEDSKYYVAGVQLYNTLYEFQTLEPSAEYNVTGVYQLYTTTKEILPRQEADIEKIESLPTATISIADITMEVEETKTITATIYPAAAADAVVYSTTSSCISISGNTITALTEGTATVTATIADSDDKYYGATKDFTVTVTPKSTKDKVVILAKYGDQWYAMMAQYVSDKTSHLAALPVTYVGGKLYNVADADKTLIEWERAVVDGKATFSNNSKYLTGKSDKTDLTLAATSCDWTISGESYLIGERTFFYNAENNWFRNFGTSNAGNKNYSGMPTVTAPVYATGDAYGRSVNLGTDGYRYGTICLPFGSTNYTGAQFFEFVGSETGKVYLGSVTTLVAGVPYIFEASAAEVAVYGDGTTAATPGSKNGLVGTFTNDTEVAIGKYILKDNAICEVAATCWVNAYRAYIVMEDVPTGVPTQMPGRRYIGMDVQGENVETGVEDLFTTDAPVKVIENGQLIIIRDDVKYNVQGQKL